MANFSISSGKNIFGQEVPELTDEELLMMIMPAGGIGGATKGAGGIMSFLKKMFGKAKSKRKFPFGYGYPTQNAHSQIDNLIAKDEILKLVKSVQKPQISSYIPDNLPKHALPPDPNKIKMILRNDPRKLRR